MVLLHFFVARLKFEGRAVRRAKVCLRYKATKEEVDFTGSEKHLASFCFPLGPEAVQPKEYQASEDFTFTLTNSSGGRYNGFCRQMLPPSLRVGGTRRFPQVLCILSEHEHPWCYLFFKVLSVVEQLLHSRCDPSLDAYSDDLPPDSALAKFLRDVGEQLSQREQGQVISVKLPEGCPPCVTDVNPQKALSEGSMFGDYFPSGDGMLDLQIPPDFGNGAWNSGISLARLIWHVPPESMLTLIAALLLERRIVFVSQSRDTVTAAVLAAQALLYPFKWHHIFVPLLPKSLADYLSAPMPFMVGLVADMLSLLNNDENEIVLLDLDLKTCNPAPGSPRDDAHLLPYREQLLSALVAAQKSIKNPTEYNANHAITGIMQEYLLRIIGSYRRFIYREDNALERDGSGTMPLVCTPTGTQPSSPIASFRGTPQQQQGASVASGPTVGAGPGGLPWGSPSSNKSNSTGQPQLGGGPPHGVGGRPDGRQLTNNSVNVTSGTPASAMGGSAGAAAGVGGYPSGGGLGSIVSKSPGRSGGNFSNSLSNSTVYKKSGKMASLSSSSLAGPFPVPRSSGRKIDDSLRGHGFIFDHTAFVKTRNNEKTREFLNLLRQSQLYERFVQERLEMTASMQAGPRVCQDTFERRVEGYPEQKQYRRKQCQRLAARLTSIEEKRAGGGGAGQGMSGGAGAGQMVQAVPPYSFTPPSPQQMQAQANKWHMKGAYGKQRDDDDDDVTSSIGFGSPSGRSAPSPEGRISDPGSFFMMVEDEDLDLMVSAAGPSASSVAHERGGQDPLHHGLNSFGSSDLDVLNGTTFSAAGRKMQGRLARAALKGVAPNQRHNRAFSDMSDWLPPPTLTPHSSASPRFASYPEINRRSQEPFSSDSGPGVCVVDGVGASTDGVTWSGGLPSATSAPFDAGSPLADGRPKGEAFTSPSFAMAMATMQQQQQQRQKGDGAGFGSFGRGDAAGTYSGGGEEGGTGYHHHNGAEGISQPMRLGLPPGAPSLAYPSGLTPQSLSGGASGARPDQVHSSGNVLTGGHVNPEGFGRGDPYAAPAANMLRVSAFHSMSATPTAGGYGQEDAGLGGEEVPVPAGAAAGTEGQGTSPRRDNSALGGKLHKTLDAAAFGNIMRASWLDMKKVGVRIASPFKAFSPAGSTASVPSEAAAAVPAAGPSYPNEGAPSGASTSPADSYALSRLSSGSVGRGAKPGGCFERRDGSLACEGAAGPQQEGHYGVHGHSYSHSNCISSDHEVLPYNRAGSDSMFRNSYDNHNNNSCNNVSNSFYPHGRCSGDLATDGDVDADPLGSREGDVGWKEKGTNDGDAATGADVSGGSAARGALLYTSDSLTQNSLGRLGRLGTSSAGGGVNGGGLLLLPPSSSSLGGVSEYGAGGRPGFTSPGNSSTFGATSAYGRYGAGAGGFRPEASAEQDRREKTAQLMKQRLQSGQANSLVMPSGNGKLQQPPPPLTPLALGRRSMGHVAGVGERKESGGAGRERAVVSLSGGAEALLTADSFFPTGRPPLPSPGSVPFPPGNFDWATTAAAAAGKPLPQWSPSLSHEGEGSAFAQFPVAPSVFETAEAAAVASIHAMHLSHEVSSQHFVSSRPALPCTLPLGAKPKFQTSLSDDLSALKLASAGRSPAAINIHARTSLQSGGRVGSQPAAKGRTSQSAISCVPATTDSGACHQLGEAAPLAELSTCFFPSPSLSTHNSDGVPIWDPFNNVNAD